MRDARRLLPLLALCLLVALAACTKRPDVAPHGVAEATWRAYSSHAHAAAAAGPYRLGMSLRYTGNGDEDERGRRVTALLWGNEDALRLDVNAGVGVVVASVAEDDSHFMLYAPREGKAYFHNGAQKPLLEVGVPLPLGLRELSLLLRGCMGDLFGTDFDGKANMGNNGLVRYAVTGRLPGTLSLTPQGQVALWEQKPSADGAWKLEMLYDGEQDMAPRRVNVSHSKGKKAVVLVKERATPATPYTDAQLRLHIPDGTPLLPLRTQARQPAL